MRKQNSKGDLKTVEGRILGKANGAQYQRAPGDPFLGQNVLQTNTNPIKVPLALRPLLQTLGSAWRTGSRLESFADFREAASSAWTPAAAGEGKERMSSRRAEPGSWQQQTRGSLLGSRIGS